MKTVRSFHPLQSPQWGEFRKKTGIKVIENPNFLMTLHKIPHTSFYIGYVPKGAMPDKKMVDELKKIGKENNCIFIQLEPNVVASENLKLKIKNLKLVDAVHPLFTKYTFVLDLTKSEEELLTHMHHKTRYNIRVAQRNDVIVKEETSDEAFETYWKLTKETTTRQGFFAHTKDYHHLMWETLRVQNSKFKIQNSYDKLTAHLFIAYYQNKPLVAWILFVYKNALYYPYGSSSNEHREVMASNLMMWEAVRFGKKLGLKKFDMWGSLGPHPNQRDPWFGFHRFKQGYGPTLIEFIGSYDLIIHPLLYEFYRIADKLRWFFLKKS